MRREQYLKHKKVIDWFYNQPEGTIVLYKTKDNIFRSWNKTSTPSWYEDYIYVINDKYAEFRKALAEGKQIESKVRHYYGGYSVDINGPWELDTSGKFVYNPKYYRIKPEEPKFKVGDWVRTDNQIGLVEVVMPYDNTYHIKGQHHPISHTNEDSLQKWEPKEGEKIWVWNNDCNYPYLATFLTMDGDMYCTSEKLCGNSYWDNCIPFTGELPNIPK